MDLISLIILIAIVGVLVWAITKFVPMPMEFRNIIVVIAIVGVCLFVLTLFVDVPSIKVGR